MSMSANTAKSKRQRAYDASGRQARALRQREETLERARDLFLERGYVATTVETIASLAGVSAATVFKTYGGKAGLVRELCQRALIGAGPIPAHERSDALRNHRDPRSVIEGWGTLLAEVSPRFSPLVLLLRTAAETDHDADVLYDELNRERLERMSENASFLAKGGHLRKGVSVATARDVLWFCSSAEFYELLIVGRRWTPKQLGRFATDTMIAALL